MDLVQFWLVYRWKLDLESLFMELDIRLIMKNFSRSWRIYIFRKKMGSRSYIRSFYSLSYSLVCGICYIYSYSYSLGY